MSNPVPEQALARNVRAMYNAHPFPQHTAAPTRESDERFRTIFEQFLHIPIDNLEGKTFLDAGCGTGENTWSWRRILPTSTKLVAVDHSTASVNIARRNSGDLSPLFGVNSLLDLGLADASVDVVYCSGVLVAVADPERAYRELVRVLKPGGYMILVLYHRYGRALHSMRRAVINLIEREDVDRRARLGGKLFGHSMRRLAERDQSPYEEILYDQFGLPCESVYSVGQALKWFRSAHIEYIGTYPAIDWAQFGRTLRFSAGLAKQLNYPPFRWLLKLFPDGPVTARPAPDFFTRATMQVVWALGQLQLFGISGRKAFPGTR